jgi:DNA helicase-2/ATP-dependent DNA helicase PcrA
MGLLDGLDAQQLQAVTSDAKTLCVLAGAGSGKTRVLTSRVARRVADETASSEHVLVLTFTRKAADELRTRLRSLGVGDGVTAGTFHAIAYAQLRQRFLDRGKSMPALSTSPIRLIEPVLQNLRLDRSMNVRVVASEIGWAKSHGLTPDDYERGLQVYRHRAPGSASQLRKVYEGYEWQKRKKHLLDYEDLLLLLTQSLRSDRAFAQAQKWRFRHFFVDEFQDLNRSQFDLLKTWMDRDDDSADLFLVGDSNQSIYGWNGADATLLQNIERHLPGVEVLRLQTNYRSSASVLAAAHAVLDADQQQHEDGEAGVPPVVRALDTDEDEATAVARAARQAHYGNRRWSDIAVLVRTNAQRALLERAFATFSIPFQATGGAAWLSTPGVRSAIDELREEVTARMVTRVPDIETMALEADEDALPYLQELAKAARLCVAESPTITVSEFLNWLEVTYRFDGPALSERRGGAVTITTFHRAKGLEWPVVFLAGVEDGLVPLGSVEGAQLDEERRLFYVAITRAREELHISWAKKRTTTKGVVDRKPSPWLQKLTRSIDVTDAIDVSDGQAKRYIDEGREALHLDKARADAAQLSLQRWRAARVKLTGLPAQTILSDEVIERIVTMHPSSIDELAAIEGLGKVRAVAVGEQLLKCLQVEEAVS